MIHHNISYPQIILDDNFLVYLNAILRSRSALRTGVILQPYQQSFEINIGTQSWVDKRKRLFWRYSDERLYTDMRCSKGYTNELEKLTHDDNGVALTVKLKKAAS